MMVFFRKGFMKIQTMYQPYDMKSQLETDLKITDTALQLSQNK